MGEYASSFPVAVDIEWIVESGAFGRGAAIVIPISTLQGMSAEQIGHAVLSLIPKAKLAHAESVADCLQMNGIEGASAREEDIELLSEYKDQSETIADVLSVLLRNRAIEAERAYWQTLKRTPTPKEKLAIKARDGGRCRYCGDVIIGTVHFDHVKPYSRGGLTVLDNLVSACMPCNSKKHDRTPEEAGMTLLPI